MSTSGRFPTHHIPDDGTRYAPGEAVRVDQSSGQVRIVKDPEGDYEVVGCRPATEYGGDPPPLRLGLRKREAPRVEAPESWPPGRSSAWP
jgi:hypothetical protein